MKCAYCGGELTADHDPRATKGWCSDRCYHLDTAEDERDRDQLGLDEVTKP